MQRKSLWDIQTPAERKATLFAFAVTAVITFGPIILMALR